jgi:hypothetical protein
MYSLFKSERLSANIKLTLHKLKPDTENIRGLNLVVVKLTTIQVIYLAKPVLTEDLYIMQKE